MNGKYNEQFDVNRNPSAGSLVGIMRAPDALWLTRPQARRSNGCTFRPFKSALTKVPKTSPPEPFDRRSTQSGQTSHKCRIRTHPCSDPLLPGPLLRFHRTTWWLWLLFFIEEICLVMEHGETLKVQNVKFFKNTAWLRVLYWGKKSAALPWEGEAQDGS